MHWPLVYLTLMYLTMRLSGQHHCLTFAKAHPPSHGAMQCAWNGISFQLPGQQITSLSLIALQ